LLTPGVRNSNKKMLQTPQKLYNYLKEARGQPQTNQLQKEPVGGVLQVLQVVVLLHRRHELHHHPRLHVVGPSTFQVNSDSTN
jgi:hypothetical protein